MGVENDHQEMDRTTKAKSNFLGAPTTFNEYGSHRHREAKNEDLEKQWSLESDSVSKLIIL
jgi:hypothetical protein